MARDPAGTGVKRGVFCGLVIAAASVAAAIFVGVAIHELNYASDHPYAYGPAKVIAWAGGGGALLSLTVGAIAVLLACDRRDRDQDLTREGS
jgi:hypothetical protein